MSYKNLLTRYGQPAKTSDHTLHLHFRDPADMSNHTDVAYYDGCASRYIAELEGYIAQIKDYRQALSARYAELATMAYQYRLMLERYCHYDGHKSYYITITKIFADGSELEEIRETYPGKDRRKALARFEEIRKQRPGIHWVKDIEKKKWER